jgi:hypothetical protein
MDDSIRAVLADIISALRETSEIQEELVSQHTRKRYVTEEVEIESRRNDGYGSTYAGMVTGNGRQLGRRKPAGGLQHREADERGKLKNRETMRETAPEETDQEKKVRKFNEAIRDAERSTLVFNLNMGNVPIMNKATISEKASLALTKMAAEKEGKNRTVPSADAVAAIDDLTSLVTNMEFYGNSTKQYKGKGSTGFCTIPVRYQFKDKDQRAFAEKTLRETCQVKCATPYPAIVRECIKQVVDHVRSSHPEDFVRVNVVAKEFSLKVARRPPGRNLPWIDYPDLLRLPDEALDVTAKKVPEGLRMFYLPVEGNDDMFVSPHVAEKSKNPPSPSSKSRKGSNGKK